jgi:hypothetical protein
VFAEDNPLSRANADVLEELATSGVTVYHDPLPPAVQLRDRIPIFPALTIN